MSDNKIEDDYDSCCWILYRGSSAVISAVLIGLKPIYLNCSEELTIDPIFEIKNWKSDVTSTKDLADRLNGIGTNYTNYHQAKQYCFDMFIN